MVLSLSLIIVIFYNLQSTLYRKVLLWPGSQIRVIARILLVKASNFSRELSSFPPNLWPILSYFWRSSLLPKSSFCHQLLIVLNWRIVPHFVGQLKPWQMFRGLRSGDNDDLATRLQVSVQFGQVAQAVVTGGQVVEGLVKLTKFVVHFIVVCVLESFSQWVI